MYGGGIGTLTISSRNAADGEDAAWVPVLVKEGGQGDSWQAASIYSVSASYYRISAARGPGIRGDIAVDNLNVVSCTLVPTAAPTHVGDTHSPTASPTAVPTLSPASSWNQLKNKCGISACDTTNGGCTIVLSDTFVMGAYTTKISFSGKTITLWGQGKILDAGGSGRFFNGQGAGSFLEVHDVVLQNGYDYEVSLLLSFHLSSKKHPLPKQLSQTFRFNSRRGHAT
jgi:hypothetical protein